MDYTRSSFLPWRMTEARELMGLSKVELAEGLGVSRGAVSQFESGQTRPSAETFARLSIILRQDPVFFLHAPERNSVQPRISYRKRAANAASNERIARIKALHTNDVLNYVFSRIIENAPDIPDSLYEDSPETLSDFDIEAKALLLRDAWGIGDLPIRNLAILLENHGIICVNDELPNKVEAFSYWVDLTGNGVAHPIIIGNQEKTYFRQRFTLAHEVGHLILHRYVDDYEIENNPSLYEQQANRFASAFLMPEQRFTYSLYSTTLNALPAQKKRWGVSIGAIVERLKDLGIIDGDRYRFYQVELSRRHWRKNEPYDRETPREESYYLNKAFQFISDQHLGSAADCVSFTGLRREELARISSNPLLFLGDSVPVQLNFSPYKA